MEILLISRKITVKIAELVFIITDSIPKCPCWIKAWDVANIKYTGSAARVVARSVMIFPLLLPVIVVTMRITSGVHDCIS